MLGHRPGAAETDVRSRVELLQTLPRVGTVEGVNFGERQSTREQPPVVNHHPHHFKLLAQAADVAPTIRLLKAVDATAGPGADIQTAVVLREGIGLGVVAQAAAVEPTLAVETIDMSAVVTAGVQISPKDRHRLDAAVRDLLGRRVEPLRDRQTRPGLRLGLIAKETGGTVERRGMQPILKDDQAADRLGIGQLSAEHPLLAPCVSKDATTELLVFRFRETRSGQSILAGTGIKLASVDRQAGDAIRSVGGTAVDPVLLAAIPIDRSRLPLARFAGARIQRPFVNGERKPEDRLARPAAIAPGPRAIVVDAELQMPPIRLIAGHSRRGLERQLKAAPRPWVVLTDQVAGQLSVAARIGFVAADPGRQTEIAARQSRGLGRWDFQPRAAAEKARRAVRRPQIDWPLDLARGRTGNHVDDIAPERPVCQQPTVEVDSARGGGQFAVDQRVSRWPFRRRKPVPRIGSRLLGTQGTVVVKTEQCQRQPIDRPNHRLSHLEFSLSQPPTGLSLASRGGAEGHEWATPQATDPT